MTGLRAITVRQPYAWALAAGIKTVENRASGTPYRGPLAITAAVPWSDDGRRDPLVLDAIWNATVPTAQLAQGWGHGVVIAVANLVDVHLAQPRGLFLEATLRGPLACCSSPWANLMYGDRTRHLVVRDVVRLAEPVPVAGALGVWTLPDDVTAAVDAQVDLAGRFW